MRSIEVAAAIIHHEGKILATQRGHGDMAGGWEFPGGKVEPGESGEDAVIREIREELDVAVYVERLVAVVDYEYENFHLHMQCFSVRIERGEPRLVEHRAARWLGADDIDSVEWLPADIEVVETIKRSGLVR